MLTLRKFPELSITRKEVGISFAVVSLEMTLAESILLGLNLSFKPVMGTISTFSAVFRELGISFRMSSIFDFLISF